VWWNLTEKGWQKLNEVRDVILSTIADVCPANSSFIITYELIDQDPYHKIFYEKVYEMVKKRNAIFLPVRLICDEDELLERVRAEDRKQFLKTSDIDLMRTRSREKSVFYSGHLNEITIKNTDLTPEQVSDLIIRQLDLLT
jgi:aminoglycoside 6'-N-acetyltransferase